MLTAVRLTFSSSLLLIIFSFRNLDKAFPSFSSSFSDITQRPPVVACRCMIKIFRGEGVVDEEGVAVKDA